MEDIQDIIDYMMMNKGLYSMEALKNELKEQGHEEDKVEKAEREVVQRTMSESIPPFPDPY